jgi:NAD-dependent SIR2 family protein deacetylase
MSNPMSFLKNIFSRKPKKYVDERGIYFYVECNRCKTVTKVRADRQFDLNRDDNGFIWRKTIVCPKCYSQMVTEVVFNNRYTITDREISGGHYVDAPEAG